MPLPSSHTAHHLLISCMPNFVELRIYQLILWLAFTAKCMVRRTYSGHFPCTWSLFLTHCPHTLLLDRYYSNHTSRPHLTSIHMGNSMLPSYTSSFKHLTQQPDTQFSWDSKESIRRKYSFSYTGPQPCLSSRTRLMCFGTLVAQPCCRLEKNLANPGETDCGREESLRLLSTHTSLAIMVLSSQNLGKLKHLISWSHRNWTCSIGAPGKKKKKERKACIHPRLRLASASGRINLADVHTKSLFRVDEVPHCCSRGLCCCKV